MARQRERRSGCGGLLVALLLLSVIGAACYALGLNPALRGLLVGEQAAPQATLEAQIERQGPTVAAGVGTLGPGTLTISEQEVNRFIAANPESLRPLESALVAFSAGQIKAELRAFGTTSTATTSLAVADGMLVAVNPSIRGPVGALVSAEAIGRALTEQINRELVAQGRRAREVRIEQDQIVIVIE